MGGEERMGEGGGGGAGVYLCLCVCVEEREREREEITFGLGGLNVDLVGWLVGHLVVQTIEHVCIFCVFFLGCPTQHKNHNSSSTHTDSQGRGQERKKNVGRRSRRGDY